MKLTIERLVRCTAQDMIDLAKIWPNSDIAALNERLSGSFAIFAARFNDRLLGAVRVIIDNEWNEGRLMDPKVRDVTRRRGVGLYLFTEVERLMPEINHWWLSADRVFEDENVMSEFMAACGFSREQDGWHKRR